MRVDGLLIVDKPEGLTSLEVVRKIKHWFSVERAGHIGTLDPFATGVLPVVLNEGRKLVPFLEEGPKEYEAMMKLGEETTTDDPTGEVISQKPFDGVTIEWIQAVFKSFLGRIQQTPPMFSAVKIKGDPLYRWARKGMEIERKERTVNVSELEVQGIDIPKIRFRVSCSPGTYIRALARDVGRKIGCGAHLVSLRRIRSGPFHLKQAIPWEHLKSLSGRDSLLPWVISPKEALPDFPEVKGDEEMLKKICDGKEIVLKDFHLRSFPDFRKGQWLRMSSPEGKLIAILRSEMDRDEIHRVYPEKVIFRPLRVFHFKND